MRFLDVKTDYAFKRVFGSEGSKELLVSFLNSVLEFSDERRIKDLTIVDPYNIPMLKGMKDTYVDVKALLDDDSRVIIEMQVLNYEGFEKRVLYNAAKNYSSQLLQGERYPLLNPIIALTITDFAMFEDQEGYLSYFKLLEKRTFIEYSDDIELVFVELPKFTKEEGELTTVRDKWIYFLKEAGSLEYIPESFDPEIRRALELANEAGLSEEELELQHKRRDFIMIQKGALSLALKRGMEEGRGEGLKEGMQKGQEEARMAIARNLLDVLDDETVSRKTGLPVELVRKLREESG